MMREEFKRLVQEISGNKDYFRECALSEQDYKDIEYVYTWYPGISETEGKQQIAWLYVNLGMRAIRDLYETASLTEDLYAELSDAKEKVDSIINRIERLKRGENGYEED